jgi:NAD(P)-dependent dehydrogenase (short-subunit alcohol dehydrogenase family)
MASHKQVALVTGASSGIGQATAELLAAHGFTVFGTSRTAASDEAAARERRKASPIRGGRASRNERRKNL